MSKLVQTWVLNQTPIAQMAQALPLSSHAQATLQDSSATWGDVMLVSQQAQLLQAFGAALTQPEPLRQGQVQPRDAHCTLSTSAMTRFYRPAGLQSGAGQFYQHLSPLAQSVVQALNPCHDLAQSPHASLRQPLSLNTQGQAQHHAHNMATGIAQPPPCLWYEIPEAAPPPTTPTFDAPRPFHFGCRQSYSAQQLPFPFPHPCRLIPPLESYMTVHTLHAQCGDIVLNPLSIQLQSDTSGYCWTGEITLSPDDFVAVNQSRTPQSPAPLISVQLNAYHFVFMAETYRDTRQFGHKSYALSGRSQTAHLGADYAQLATHNIHQALYARQIADHVLSDTGFQLGRWDLVDWLIPDGVYSIAGKTPIAVISDIAQCAGGFVYSDPAQKILHVKSHYPAPAWQWRTPKISLPANVILRISGQKTVTQACYGVFVSATHPRGKFAKVVRQGSDGSPEAPMLSHDLYTDESVCLAAGAHALSNTGDYKIEQLTVPLMTEYGLDLAQLGDLWQVHEPDGAWLGVVGSIQLEISWKNNAPYVVQNVSLRRYLAA